MEIAIVKYNAGNMFSVVNALKRLGITPQITDEAAQLQKADRVLFPGQGNAKTAMDYLRQPGLDKIITGLRQPVLGICVGQQLLCRHSEEGNTPCLGICDGDVKKFGPNHHDEKVPAMGWNELTHLKSPLFKGLHDGDYTYFVHSYYVPVCENTIAQANYIHPYSAAIHKDNFWATQFHPEKSGQVGETILRNFLEMKD